MYFSASGIPIWIQRIVRQNDNFIWPSFRFICVIDEGYSMRDEIVDIGLMAVAAFIQKGRTIDYTGTIRGLGTQDSECCMQRKEEK